MTSWFQSLQMRLSATTESPSTTESTTSSIESTTAVESAVSLLPVVRPQLTNAVITIAATKIRIFFILLKFKNRLAEVCSTLHFFISQYLILVYVIFRVTGELNYFSGSFYDINQVSILHDKRGNLLEILAYSSYFPEVFFAFFFVFFCNNSSLAAFVRLMKVS